MAKYIYEHPKWTDFSWQDKAINAVFGEVRLMQGKIIGQMNAPGFSVKEEATLTALTLDVVKSSEIEGELLNIVQATLPNGSTGFCIASKMQCSPPKTPHKTYYEKQNFGNGTNISP